MAGRFVGCAAAALLVLSVDLIAETQRRPPPPAGNRISARDGDIVVLENDARVKIVRQREANVRTIFSSAERWIVLVVDQATADGGPDGRVDMTYSFTGVAGDWPMEDRWEGFATIEDYSLAGESSPSRLGFVGPQGLVQFLGSPNDDLFRDSRAIAVLSFTGAGRGGAGGMAFDQAERWQVDQVRRNSQTRVDLPSAVTSTLTLTAGTEIGTRTTTTTTNVPIRVGGNIRPPTKIVDVRPVMPEQALRARIMGVVIIEITIDTDGTVKDARVLRSVPLLDQAALDAVRQWRFEPTVLDGQPAPVMMTVTVQFQ